MSELRPVLIGVMIDPLVSFEEAMGCRSVADIDLWAETVLKFLKQVLSKDINNSNIKVVTEFGENPETFWFDQVRNFRELNESRKRRGPRADGRQVYRIKICDEIIDCLERTGAPRIRTWVNADKLSQVLEEVEAIRIKGLLQKDDDLRRKTAIEFLPQECREHGFFKAIVSWFKQASESDIIYVHDLIIDEEMKRAVSRASNSELPKSNSMTYYWWCYGKRSYNGDSGIKKLVFFESFKNIVQVMASHENDLHEKILVIVSEGVKKNEIGEEQIDKMKKLTTSEAIKVVSCYIAENPSVESLTIYKPESARYPYWEDQAKFLFDISSAVSSANIPLHILNDYNWQIDDSGNMENDKIKLFFHANSPTNLSAVYTFAEELITRKDCLLPFLGHISLIGCINLNQRKEFKPRDQGDTDDCLLFAASTAIYLATRLIEGRSGGYPDVDEVLRGLQEKWKVDELSNQQLELILKEYVKSYRLCYSRIETREALDPWFSKQVVIGSFELTENQWERFEEFFERTPKGILTKVDLGQPSGEIVGHAVVLASYDSSSLRFMNSWGKKMDKGFFRIQNPEVLNMKFMRVYVDTEALSDDEKLYYKTHGLKNLAKKLMNLKGLRYTRYACPKCHTSSRLSKFRGRMFEPECPHCKKTFEFDEPGSTLEVYQYLQSASGELE